MTKTLSVEVYCKEHKSQWDQFVGASKNGVFLFYRDYMEYHSDRFNDYSLVFFDSGNIAAVLPANVKDGVLFTHGGLTFGGVVSGQRMRTLLMLQIFDILLLHLREAKINKIVYKTIPCIYHKVPAGEDLYALFRHNAKLTRRDVSSTIFLERKLPFTKERRWSINKSKKAGLRIERSYDFKTFIAIEKDVLRRKYNVKPTHTAEELQLLAERFPENIKLFAAFKDNVMVAGVIVYESENVAHTQYISSTDEGKKMCAIDSVLNFLITEYYMTKQYFDFGISTENEGRYLNGGLITQKEEFGASAVVYDTYELEV